jgi:RNA polymerase sigma factor (TIGR02999 family)
VDQNPGESECLASLLEEAGAGVSGAKDRLFTSLYGELRQLAERQLRRGGGAPVSPTTLLHETYLNISKGRAVFPDRGRFMGYAARVMRNLLVDLVRVRGAQKRGAEFRITQLDEHAIDRQPGVRGDEGRLARLSEALDELAEREPRLSEVVDLRYFCGFSMLEIAAMREVSERTVQRDWDKARLFLYHELDETSDS